MRIKYSKEVIDKLKKNPCVFNCTERLLSYTFEFKKRALQLQSDGVVAKEIWRRSGFDITIWRKNYFGETIKDWRKMVIRNEIEGCH